MYNHIKYKILFKHFKLNENIILQFFLIKTKLTSTILKFTVKFYKYIFVNTTFILYCVFYPLPTLSCHNGSSMVMVIVAMLNEIEI